MPGFVFLQSYYEALRPLPDDMRLMLYDAIFDYAFRGMDPEKLPPMANGYFLLLKPNIDSSIKRYTSSAENGKRGGRPKRESKNNPAKTQQKPRGNLEKDKDREKERETEWDKENDHNFSPQAAPARKSFSELIAERSGVD